MLHDNYWYCFLLPEINYISGRALILRERPPAPPINVNVALRFPGICISFITQLFTDRHHKLSGRNGQKVGQTYKIFPQQHPCFGTLNPQDILTLTESIWIQMDCDSPLCLDPWQSQKNHIRRQMEAGMLKSFKILRKATNWLAAKCPLLQTDQIMIYL